MKKLILFAFLSALFVTTSLQADTPFFFSTNTPDGLLATASRPEDLANGKFEIESADDFVATTPISITSATFTGLLPTGFNPANVGEVRIEIYRVFPNDSNVGRTSGPPTFSTPQVPTRVNSPGDVEFADRDTATNNLTFTTRDIGAFTAANSIQPGGIHAFPNQLTKGNGPVTGEEVQFNVNFTSPFSLPTGHYFFVPQVGLPGPTDNFFWLSVPRPIVPPGTPFPAGSTDLQAWTRDSNLDPDWLREGTDIVSGAGGTTFNEAFSLTGTVPDSGSTVLLLGSTFPVLFYLRRRFSFPK